MKTLFTVLRKVSFFYFFKEINNDSTFCIEEDCQHDLLYCLLRLELFFLSESAFSLRRRHFRHRFVIANPCLSHFYTFLTQTCFSTHIDCSSVNFTWFVLLSHQKLDETSVQSRRTLLSLRPFWIPSQRNNFCEIKIISAMNQFQTMRRLHIWKKKGQKSFVFSKDFPHLLNFHRILNKKQSSWAIW